MSDLPPTLQQVSPALAKCNILVVDDSRTHRKLVELSLRRAGFHRLTFAADGQQALETIREQVPDLVLLDLVMPVLDGFGVCEALRRQPEYADVPIVVMTSLESVEHRMRALSAGATDLILKPVYQPQLITHAICHLERRMLIRGLRDYQERTVAELAIARQMQEALLPDARTIRQIQDRHGIDIAAILEPCAELGGDLWGVWSIDASRVGLFVCDVSGHGTIAAINTFRIHTILTRNEFDRAEPGPFLSAVNDRLAGLLSTGQFATMLYCVLDTRRDLFSYAAAGCPEPVLALPATPASGLDGSGLPLGIVAGVQYPTRHAPFTPGSNILLHSDAFTEARIEADATVLGEERARVLVSEALASKAPQEVVAGLFGKIGELAGNVLDDDLTLICISRPDIDAEPAAGLAQASATVPAGRVLAVANTLLQRLMVKRVALMTGLDSDVASDLAAAGRFLADNCYDVVIIDLKLPADEKLELLRTVAATTRPPRLVLAGVAPEDLVRFAASLNLNVAATLPTPMEVPRLRDALLSALSTRDVVPEESTCDCLSEADLRSALAEQEVQFSFQPQMSLTTRQIVGAEALARWTSPRYGIVPTAMLSRIASGGSARLLADATLRAAITACREWRANEPNMRVAVNFSAASLADAALPELVQARLREAGLPASALIVEVTEADVASCIPILAALHDLGACVALDEFGTGDTGVRAMERLPIGMLKLSRSMVQHCASEPRTRRMLNATVAVGRTLGLTVVAVGVENHDAEQVLREAGCDVAQGWLYGPALSPKAVSELLRQQQREQGGGARVLGSSPVEAVHGSG